MRIRTRHLRHDRRIHDPEPFHPPHATFRIDNRLWIVHRPHTAGTDRMHVIDTLRSQPGVDPGIVPKIRDGLARVANPYMLDNRRYRWMSGKLEQSPDSI